MRTRQGAQRPSSRRHPPPPPLPPPASVWPCRARRCKASLLISVETRRFALRLRARRAARAPKEYVAPRCRSWLPNELTARAARSAFLPARPRTAFSPHRRPAGRAVTASRPPHAQRPRLARPATCLARTALTGHNGQGRRWRPQAVSLGRRGDAVAAGASAFPASTRMPAPRALALSTRPAARRSPSFMQRLQGLELALEARSRLQALKDDAAVLRHIWFKRIKVRWGGRGLLAHPALPLTRPAACGAPPRGGQPRRCGAAQPTNPCPAAPASVPTRQGHGRPQGPAGELLQRAGPRLRRLPLQVPARAAPHAGGLRRPPARPAALRPGGWVGGRVPVGGCGCG